MASNQQGSGSSRGGSGNFADDPQRASQAGKKGAERSHGSQASGHQPASTQQGSGKSGNVADDRAKSSDAGKKGGSR
jgi:general stress protein YciG